MCSVVKEQTLTDDSLQTFLCEIESIVNNRPITRIPGDSDDQAPLTPNHLLMLKGDLNLPPAITSDLNQYAKRRWKQVQYLSDLFWRRWTREYLPQLQVRQKWLQPQRNAEIGDIVMVVSEVTRTRNVCPLGKVLETIPDKNRLIRQVKVRTKTGILT